ncbi:O-antigen ligase [Jatrophihabitans sp. GAS493]|uniref:O-antigen ligase family protein n=1 Tax=Jatrophihabitans sp. GAS493 TaxID=1907575 RepID=UPI000BB78B9A|nr:hypothetical protein [Jatrophihabitans sp. GAS493]SOD75206.1 O-antigen ligase [Jatrophihabitans sp. GAS493]
MSAAVTDGSASLLVRARRLGTELRDRIRDFGWAPFTVCVSIVLLLVMRQSFTVPYTGVGQSPAQLLILVTGGLWVLTRLAGQRSGVRLGAIGIAVFAQFMAALIAFTAGAYALLTPSQVAASQRALITTCSLTAFLLFVVMSLRTTRQIEIALRCVLAAAAVSGIYALGYVVTGTDLGALVRLPGLKVNEAATAYENARRAGLARPRGAAGHPLELGALMTVVIPIGLGVCFAAQRRGTRVWPWSLATAIVAAAAAASLSRSAVIGTAAALLVMVPRWPVRRAVTLLAGLGIASVGAYLLGSKVLSAIVTLFVTGSQDGSLESRGYGRFYVYYAVGDHIWVGQGLGTYNVPIQPVLDNQYLDQLMETGVIGLTAFAGLLVTALLVATRVASQIDRWRVPNVDPVLAELASGVGGAMMVVITTNLVLDTYGFIQISTLMWILFAVVAAMRNVADIRPPFPDLELLTTGGSSASGHPASDRTAASPATASA